MDTHVKSLLIALGMGIVLGAFIVNHQWQRDYPQQTLYLTLTNERAELIPLVKIEHGSDHLQERILITQLRAGETRTISLNHEPTHGYSVEAQLTNHEKTEACVGKLSSNWVNHISITPQGIMEQD